MIYMNWDDEDSVERIENWGDLDNVDEYME